ncbi:DUF4249 family protein [Gilvibacter sediminis]|uniref:DUF4249 family protein n=1 Tax=Gilvibacter sediminis TaxID=379071 RepID=UPI002350BEE7|nr:DUF4249 family protein [Gilvibacter sediminis]MDC7997815.1 DUF4249 family protein [Gilvibacter sediminis]
MQSTLHINAYSLRFLAVFALVFSMWSCEDVIEVDTPSEDPRLIVDALIRVDTTTAFTNVRIQVSQTNGFFESIPPVDLQQITLTGLEGGLSAILLETSPGVYEQDISTPALSSGEEIFLQIDFENEFYVAYATYVPAPQIDELKQGDGFLFDEDDTEVIVRFTDIPEEENFYVFDFGFGNFLASEDTFYEDQEFVFSYFYDDEVETGDELTISILGADAPFYNYMNQLVEQSEDDLNPFQTPTLTVRGNLINATEIDNDEFFDNVEMENNFALGYFAIVQEHKASLTIE